MRQEVGDKNIIELNGKRYNALTGSLLQVPQKAKQGLRKSSSAIDGFMGKTSSKVSETLQSKTPKLALPKIDSFKKLSSRHSTNKHHAHKPEPAKTLMRSAVKKPALSPKATKRIQTPAGSLPARLMATLPAAARASLNERRLIRSQQVSKSRLINRFKAQDILPVPKQLAPLAVKKPLSEAIPTVKAVAQYTTSRSQSILAAGLARATSHQEKPVTSTKAHNQKLKSAKQRRVLLNSLITIVIVALGLSIAGFFVYKDLPHIELRLASARSGVAAEIPAYLPPGFRAVTPVNYAKGTVTVSFRSNATNQFSIIQRNSNWDSQTLQDSFVAITSSTYQTFQDEGRTIYIYGKGNATWVNAGVWYQISDNANLNNNQLLNIATSM